MIKYRCAGEHDIDLIVSSILEFLSVTSVDDFYTNLKGNVKNYFTRKMQNRECAIILALKNSEVIGTGIMFYHKSAVSDLDRTDGNAYIANVYVNERYRRQKIGSMILEKLMEDAKEKSYCEVRLKATEIGKKLYERYGFTIAKNGMGYKVL